MSEPTPAGETRAAYDIAVIGAGPAGLAAAAASARYGFSTVLIDEQLTPGGQIYRAITETPLRGRKVLGARFWEGAKLLDALRTSGAQYVPGATVWSLTRNREIGISAGAGSQVTTARRVIVCTGAMERPFPIPGWTLPGVMTAGAGQILLKTSAVIPSGRTVLAGCGPLLWLIAWQYLNAGAKIDAMLITTDPAQRKAALSHVWPFLRSKYLRDGLALVRAVRGKVPMISGVTALRAIGDGKLTSVAYTRGNGAESTIEADTLLLHQGVIPNVNLPMAAGVEHRWSDMRLCWEPALDEYGNTSIDGIAIAGDGAGIGGAEASVWRGRLAALSAARALGRLIPPIDEEHIKAHLAKVLRGRDFLDTLYRPANGFRVPAGETLVCRCEEVSARQITDLVALGCPGPNQMKAFIRCGMGPCQGRLCGTTVTEVIANARRVTPQEVGYYRIRQPVKPITVGELAALPKPEAAVKAVVRG